MFVTFSCILKRVFGMGFLLVKTNLWPLICFNYGDNYDVISMRGT